MRWQQRLPQIAFALACLGMLIPHAPASAGSMMARPAVDVALTPNGTLQGQLVDSQGRPLAGRTVALRKSGRDVARTMTGSDGVYRGWRPCRQVSTKCWQKARAGRSASGPITLHRRQPARWRYSSRGTIRSAHRGTKSRSRRGSSRWAAPRRWPGIGIGLAGSHDLDTKVKTTTSP